MNSKRFALFFALCVLASDLLIPVALAGHHGNRGGHGLDLLLAAGILAKILRKKGHHHHHHGHGHEGRHAAPHHHPMHHHGEGGYHGEAGTRNVEVVHIAPPMGGYSSYYPGSYSYGGPHQASSTSFSASIEYPFSAPSAPHGHHMPYAGPASAASYLGYEPQPVQYMPPMPMGEGGAPASIQP